MQIKKQVKELGGLFLWSLDGSCTHYLHQGPEFRNRMVPTDSSMLFSELRQAFQNKLHIVHPQWLVECSKASKRLPETEYPPHFTPRNGYISHNSSNRVGTDFEGCDESLQSLMDKSFSASTERNKRPRVTISIKPSTSSLFNTPIDATENTAGVCKENITPPTENTSTTLNAPKDIGKAMCIVLTAVTGQERTALRYKLSRIISKMQSKNDQLIDNMVIAPAGDKWLPQCTHLIAPRLSATEKVLAAIASGDTWYPQDKSIR